jgi:hypothetical protein
MRNLRRIAAAAASTGLLALGGLGASSGIAKADTTPYPVTSCTVGGGTLLVGFVPSCTSTGSVLFPTSITVSVNPGGILTGVLGTILSILGGIEVKYSGTCAVDGANKNFSGNYQVTNSTQPTSTTLDLQSLVGSPVPNGCTMSVTETTMNPIPAITLLPAFNITDAVTATTATPGSIWQQTTSNGAICADIPGNGNVGTAAQVYECLGDLAAFFSATGTGQLVHNGDCLTDSGSAASLQPCTAANPSQRWTGGTSKSELVNRDAGPGQGCLTAPSPANLTQLTLASCTGAANQLWTAPAQTAGTGS